jgi:hypothetical protein
LSEGIENDTDINTKSGEAGFGSVGFVFFFFFEKGRFCLGSHKTAHGFASSCFVLETHKYGGGLPLGVLPPPKNQTPKLPFVLFFFFGGVVASRKARGGSVTLKLAMGDGSTILSFFFSFFFIIFKF